MMRLQEDSCMPKARTRVRGKRLFLRRFGRHEPYCSGRCLVASDLEAGDNCLFASIFMIVSPVIVWFLLVAPKFPQHLMLIAMGVVGLLTLLSLLCLLGAHLTEPGIMFTEPNIEDGTYMVVHSGQRFELRQFRAKFCRVTENCIERFDHFCPWVGNAVGARNYRWFFFFLICVCLLDLAIGASCALQIISHKAAAHHKGLAAFIDSAGQEPAASAVLVFGIFILLLVGPLAAYHMWLVAKNLTTNEHIKGTYDTTPNPHDRGCCVNCFGMICVPAPRSKVFGMISAHTAVDQSEQDDEPPRCLPVLVSTK